MFLERVYGIETKELFYKLLEDAFLPDLRAATILDRVSLTFFRITPILTAFLYYFPRLMDPRVTWHCP